MIISYLFQNLNKFKKLRKEIKIFIKLFVKEIKNIIKLNIFSLK